MLTESETKFLKGTLGLLSKLKLATVQFKKEEEILQTKGQTWVRCFTALVVTLHVSNVAFCIWRMRSSTTQAKVLTLFLIVASLVATFFRLAVVKSQAEFANLVNNIFSINSILGR